MKVITHIAAGAVVSIVTGMLTTLSAGAGLFIATGFLDIDHLHHYRYAGFPMNPKSLLYSVLSNETELETRYSFRRGVPGFRGFPVFHCIEFILIIVTIAYLTGSLFLYGCAGGIILHLLMDIRHYPCSPLFFSFTWRYFNGKQVLKAWQTWKK
ncbi:MAG: hypothetical protein H8D05_01405 [FCB group bacterium]|nr:hypothetical protein [FCB group bacterium]